MHEAEQSYKDAELLGIGDHRIIMGLELSGQQIEGEVPKTMAVIYSFETAPSMVRRSFRRGQIDLLKTVWISPSCHITVVGTSQ